MKRSTLLLVMLGCASIGYSQQAHQLGSSNSLLTFLTNGAATIQFSTFKTPIYFKANRQESSIQLVWHTKTGEEFQGFEVSKSSDGESFETLSWVKPKTTQEDFEEYSYVDFSVETDEKYIYRLKKLNEDGSVELAQVEAFSRKMVRKAQIQVIPKIQDKEVLTIESNTEGEIKIFNSLGHPIEEHRLEVGENEIDISLWTKGKYYVAFETTTGEKILKKFYK